MRSMKINRGWDFSMGTVDHGKRLRGIFGDRKVNLPHDYMTCRRTRCYMFYREEAADRVISFPER